MRHRNMYYATGLPGCVRLGYSPGWSRDGVKRMGPCAQYMRSAQAAGPSDELGVLRQQAQALGQQLEQIQSRIAALEAER